MARLRSKRIITNTGLEVTEAYCRKCRRTLPAGTFYSATDKFIDSNGLMSICSECVDEIYRNILSVTNSIELSIHKVCKMLNVIYLPAAVEAAKRDEETRLSQGKSPSRLFGRYKSKIGNLLRTGKSDGIAVDLTYQDDESVQKIEYTVITPDDTPDYDDLRKFWGTDSREDIVFLEREMAKYRMGYVLDTPAQETLVKELCYLILQIDKDRRQDKSVEAKLKSLSSLMNSMGISPNMETASNAGKSESLGVRIKELEETSPAEWYQDKSIYKDVDGIESYIEKFITSPIRAFMTGNKEFDISEDSDSSEDDGYEDSVLEE